MSRALIYHGDTVVIRTPGPENQPPIDRDYKLVRDGRDYRLLLALPSEPGYYMTSNNLADFSGVLIERTENGDWVLHDTNPDASGSHGDRAREQVARWHETLGLTRVYLTTKPPVLSAPLIP